ncbi:hypothetical protein NDU88_001889 [Pleurodeles waltl]|uniref:Uncharacterized protein n=1 Tax=Pleurodeles waltl TaxID=8319 RepID=A0AAV7UVH5_PLEWA|nr:hypothetical protein NDU88_001889 [Pleurodeles waltl]
MVACKSALEVQIESSSRERFSHLNTENIDYKLSGCHIKGLELFREPGTIHPSPVHSEAGPSLHSKLLREQRLPSVLRRHIELTTGLP